MANQASHHIVLVGGGTAGLSVAARLRKLAPQVKLTLLDPATKHYYQPLWTLVGAGEADKSTTERDQATLIPQGVEWIREGVSEFDPEHNAVRTTSGRKIDYDALVVAPGIQIDWAKISGLPEALGRNGVCSNYSYESVDSTWNFIRNFKGGEAIFTQPSTPIKCGGAPQKIMYLADDAFRRQQVRDRTRVSFLSGAASLFAVKKYAEALQKVVARKEIDARYKHDLIALRPGSREAIFRNLDSGEEIVRKYDLIHVTPPMSAPDFIKRSPLANAAGWVDVHANTLQHLRYPNIFAAGDASSLPTSKTGAAIRKQAPVLVQNLLAFLHAQKLVAEYDGYTSCPLTTGYNKLILAEFNYKLEPQETFPFDQSRERMSMYLLKKHLLPTLYWEGMLKGRA
ncbi:MAG: NAD(P)/FAD-dependent oxidoreductase [Bdellovibrionales bacterium]|nr:NAD(P)/FAD-dependent oxidoreductase [Bdellovibrionales bacterium]